MTQVTCYFEIGFTADPNFDFLDDSPDTIQGRSQAYQQGEYHPMFVRASVEIQQRNGWLCTFASEGSWDIDMLDGKALVALKRREYTKLGEALSGQMNLPPIEQFIHRDVLTGDG